MKTEYYSKASCLKSRALFFMPIFHPRKEPEITMKMNPIVHIILTLALVTTTVLATAWLTYRATMKQIQIEIVRDTVYLTAWGQTDEYTIGE